MVSPISVVPKWQKTVNVVLTGPKGSLAISPLIIQYIIYGFSSAQWVDRLSEYRHKPIWFQKILTVLQQLLIVARPLRLCKTCRTGHHLCTDWALPAPVYPCRKPEDPIWKVLSDYEILPMPNGSQQDATVYFWFTLSSCSSGILMGRGSRCLAAGTASPPKDHRKWCIGLPRSSTLGPGSSDPPPVPTTPSFDLSRLPWWMSRFLSSQTDPSPWMEEY